MMIRKVPSAIITTPTLQFEEKRKHFMVYFKPLITVADQSPKEVRKAAKMSFLGSCDIGKVA